MASSKRTTRVRSSVTGRYVPKNRAKTSPRTTETEVVRRKK